MATRRGLLGYLLVGGVLLLGHGAWLAADDTAATMYTVLPRDAIAAILRPAFVPAQQAHIAPDAAMIGVVFNGEAHVYSAVLLNAHEIVNDVVGGAKVATTW